MSNTRRKIYESIMRQISKVVRQQLNESFNDEPDFETIKSYLSRFEFNGKDINEVEELLNLSYYDEGIDDGLDDDDYLMYRSYTLNKKYWLRLYYPQSTNIISYWSLYER